MKNIDYKLFTAVLLLMIWWVIMISSVSVFSSYTVTSKMVDKWLIKEAYNYFYLLRSVSHIAISLIILAVIVKINYYFFEKYSPVFLGVIWLLLVYVLVSWETYYWAKWWISVPWIPFLIQPTEFLKISLILFLAMYFKKNNHLLKNFKTGFLPYVWIVSVVVLLVWLQPDFWTLLVLIPITWIMFFYAWANKKHILSVLALWLVLFTSVYSFWSYDKENWKLNNKLGYITQRVDNFFKSNEDLFKSSEGNSTNDKTYQTKQWLISIWSGGFSGKWFWQSIQKYWYLPEVQWDFIFAVIVEELGFIWWWILILIYLYIGYRGLYIAYNVKDKFAKYTALWITTWFLWQTFVNIWVNLNIVPLTWVTLPFISYGWSSLLALAIWTWILLTISRHIEEKPAYARMNNKKFIF